ncbi:MAG: hypothetical protein ABSC90_11080 [Acidimicrobiales bacterium]
MKRTLVVLSMVMGLIAVSVTLGGAAWATTNSSPPVSYPGGSGAGPTGGTPPATTMGQHPPCGCATTTTTAPPATTTTTSPPPTPTTLPPVPAPISGPVNPAPVVPPPVAVPLTALPFTGVPTKPLLLIGVSLVALGLLLASSRESWRRSRRRLVAMVLGFLPRFAPIW